MSALHAEEADEIMHKGSSTDESNKNQMQTGKKEFKKADLIANIKDPGVQIDERSALTRWHLELGPGEVFLLDIPILILFNQDDFVKLYLIASLVELRKQNEMFKFLESQQVLNKLLDSHKFSAISQRLSSIDESIKRHAKFLGHLNNECNFMEPTCSEDSERHQSEDDDKW